jgi:predicted restriction endonuclease
MASQIKTLDKQWSLLVKYKAGYKCEVCGKTQHQTRLNSHHIIGRRNKMTRWDLRNGVCLCVRHHKFGIQSAHEDSPWFNVWLEKYRKEDLEYVNSIKNQIKKWTPSEREELIEEYKMKIKEYEESSNIS